MKKKYMQPAIQVVQISNEALMLFQSGANATGSDGNSEHVSDEPSDDDLEWGDSW